MGALQGMLADEPRISFGEGQVHQIEDVLVINRRMPTSMNSTIIN